MADTKKWNSKAQAKYRQSDKYKITALRNHLKRKYNLSLETYNEMLVLQDYKCWICKSKTANRDWQTKDQRLTLFVDHCHTTGKVRGLLCNKCNVGLAMFNEDKNLFTQAILYLAKEE